MKGAARELLRAEQLYMRFGQLARTTAANLAEMGEILRLFREEKLYEHLGCRSWSDFCANKLKASISDCNRMIEASQVFGVELMERGYLKPSDTRIKFMAAHLEGASQEEKRRALEEAAKMPNADFRAKYHLRPPRKEPGLPRQPNGLHLARVLPESPQPEVRRGGAQPKGSSQSANVNVSYYVENQDAEDIKRAIELLRRAEGAANQNKRSGHLLAEICRRFLRSCDDAKRDA